MIQVLFIFITLWGDYLAARAKHAQLLSAIVSKAKNEVNERLNMVLIGDGE
jgi:hypothetical protein